MPLTVRGVPVDAWTLERFGLTPRKLVGRLGAVSPPKVVCVAVPKSGTHLLERALCLHPRLRREIGPTVTPENVGRWGGFAGLLSRMRAGQVVLCHLPFRPPYPDALAAAGAKAIFVTRDPRDVVVSIAHYLAGRGDHPLHAAFAERTELRDRIELATLGSEQPVVASIAGLLADFEGWLRAAHVVRFEDLVGPAGGGSREAQAKTVRGIYTYLGLDVGDGFVASLCARLFSRASPTFRKGTVGQWRAHFDARLEELFERNAGAEARAYGY